MPANSKLKLTIGTAKMLVMLGSSYILGHRLLSLHVLKAGMKSLF